MGFINIFVGSYCKMSCADNKFIISGEKEAKFPLEDINSIVIENIQSTISTILLTRLAEANIAVYLCDERHLPAALLLPYNQYYSQRRIYNLQINAKKPLLKQLWQTIIKQKISNQAENLKLAGNKNDSGKLIELSKQVQSDDSTNIESISARLYFKALFGKDFDRRSDNGINSCLNYGYAIIRGLIARSLVANGFMTFLGIHHCNELNNFNLVDDLIEPYRPIVDRIVVRENLTNIDTNTKKALLNLNNFDVAIDGKKQLLPRSIEILVDSLINSLQKGGNFLKLPIMSEMLVHNYE